MSPAEKLRSIGVNPADVHIDAAPVIARRLANLESRLAEAERERDSARETNAAMDRGIEAIAVALGTTGAELGFDHDVLVHKAQDLRARLAGIEAAAREAVDLLGVVASEVEGDAASVFGQVRWARDARRVEASIRAALEGGG